MISEYKSFVVEIADETNYGSGPADNLNSHDTIYDADSNIYQTKHSLSVFENNEKISSVLITGNAGGTTIHKQSFVIKNDEILICCSEMVYSFKLPKLTLNWSKAFDQATNFEIYTFKNDFIIHGEMSIFNVTSTGEVKWEFSARDIFVNLNGHKAFEIIGEQIKIIDFENYEYILDANGQVIGDRMLE